ncbi:amino acid ABC transporter substrate-binding protein [Rhodobacteraceae bacterium NNCM2]|nr:amino acid ABC transporter substrate-binding protein [Coraliihabitans acroporae]
MDKVLAEKRLKLGYRSDAAPFSTEADGRAFGFTVELCAEIGALMKQQLGLDEFHATLVHVDTGDRFNAIERGDVDLLCGATTRTLERREIVSFSIPTFLTGVSAVVSSDASPLLKEVLVEKSPAAFSTAATEEALKGAKLGVRANTTASEWLDQGGVAKVSGEPLMDFSDHAEGIKAVAEGRIDAYFADKAILDAQLRNSDYGDKVLVSKKAFTTEPYAIALPRGDEDLRLAVDRALSRIYASGAIVDLLTKHFGQPSPEIILFYSFAVIPE